MRGNDDLQELLGRADPQSVNSKIISYKARYRLPDGNKPSRNFPVKGAPPGEARQQAEDWLAEVRRDRNYGVHVDQRAGRTVIFAQEAAHWLESMAAGIEASTYRDYESLLLVWLLPASALGAGGHHL